MAYAASFGLEFKQSLVTPQRTDALWQFGTSGRPEMGSVGRLMPRLGVMAVLVVHPEEAVMEYAWICSGGGRRCGQ
jgi:hypothetical protein